MPLSTECRRIDYSRYAVNTHSVRIFASVYFNAYSYLRAYNSGRQKKTFLCAAQLKLVKHFNRIFQLKLDILT